MARARWYHPDKMSEESSSSSYSSSAVPASESEYDDEYEDDFRRRMKLTKPTPQHAAWQDMEVGMFFHFDIPVFSDLKENQWRQGALPVERFNPERLDTDQWMEAAKAIGAKYTVFVAKHCSGFLTWQSDAYAYGVRQSPWRGGKGDLVRDYVESCRRCGIQPGLYCNVMANARWQVDRGRVNWGQGGDDAKQERYARVGERMLSELWGNYGPLFEIWFDGGALPPSQGGPDLIPLLHKLQPQAMVFQGPATTIRWIGNERGVAPYPCWATVRSRDEAAIGRAAPGGDPDGSVWLPGECDVPIRNHAWFWHPGEEHKLYSLAELMDMYYKSVGRNCNLLLNANIDRDGLVPEPDFQRYREFGAEIRRRFGQCLAETSGEGGIVELSLPRPMTVDHAILMEQIAEGERVREYVVEGLADGAWRELCRGASIGHKRIERFEPIRVSTLRLRVLRSVAKPLIRRLAACNTTETP